MEEEAVERTKNWIEKVVIHYDLCPFAKYPYVNNQIRYTVFEGQDAEALTSLFMQELMHLDSSLPEEVETTLIILPNLFSDFFDYLDYLQFATNLLTTLHMDGKYQIASFHPKYQFTDTSMADCTNYTNRSPYPMLHLLRESSVSRAVASHPDIHQIPISNQKLMKGLGESFLIKLWNDISAKN